MFLIMHQTPGILLLHCLEKMITVKTFTLKTRMKQKMMQNRIMKTAILLRCIQDFQVFVERARAMLEWMGGSRQKVTISRKSTHHRQRQYFEQRKQEERTVGYEGHADETSIAGRHQMECRSLDILILLDLSTFSAVGKCYPSNWIGKPFGSIIFSNRGGLVELWTLILSHRTQILYIADISFVIMYLEVVPGCLVLETGTGSGSLTTLFARAVAPTGRVYL